jgi:hypothetical protein
MLKSLWNENLYFGMDMDGSLDFLLGRSTSLLRMDQGNMKYVCVLLNGKNFFQ